MAEPVPLSGRTDVWRGHASTAAIPAEPSGFVALDALLPGGGWARGAVTEVLHASDGIGELALLLPTLARLTRDGKQVAWVAPPYLPYAPALLAAGIDLQQLAVIDADARQAPWAAEQCLRSGTCAAVLCWPGRSDHTRLRRLQLAAESGQGLGFLLRDARWLADPSPAPVRLAVMRAQGALRLRLHKCRGRLKLPPGWWDAASSPAANAAPSSVADAQPPISTQAAASSPSPACRGGLGWGGHWPGRFDGALSSGASPAARAPGSPPPSLPLQAGGGVGAASPDRGATGFAAGVTGATPLPRRR